MINSITDFSIILVYWVPLLLCLIGYTIRTWVNYRKDVIARELDQYYVPTDKIGTLIGRVLVTITPAVNLFVLFFDLAPRFFGNFFVWIERVFNTPVVPSRK